MKLCVIGDIHGQHSVLLNLLEKLEIYKQCGIWNNPNNYKLVFLGDLNDYTENAELKSSLKTFITVRELICDIEAVLLNSNHIDKFRRWLSGSNVQLTHGLDNTVGEMNLLFAMFEKETLITSFKEMWIKWLSELPLSFMFSENRKLYVCAHAYFDDKLYNTVMNDPHWDETSRGREWLKSQCIYGRQKDGARYEWWNEPWYGLGHFRKNYYIFGHYHIEKDGYNYSIIDSDKELIAFIPSENRKIKVEKIK